MVKKIKRWERLTIKTVLEQEMVKNNVTIKGFVKSVRKSKKFSFLHLNDGSIGTNLQVIVDLDLKNYGEISSLLSGSSVAVTGNLVKSGGRGQSVEMQAVEIKIYGGVDDSYPLQKKKMSLEFLRENAHLRMRTNTFGAIFRIRHKLALATHKFFDDLGLFYLNSPIITANDAEGAGEMFNVTAFDLKDLPKTQTGEIDFSKGYFGRAAHLSVTGQLEAECFAMGMGGVYTFGPAFRAENSNTSRHLSEFWMVEPEVAFTDLEEIADLAMRYSKHLIKTALDECRDDLDFLLKTYSDDPEKHISNLNNVIDNDFEIITHKEALDILIKSGYEFEKSLNLKSEMQTEHERYLAEVHFKVPVIVTDYPKEFKAFYMKLNDDGETVRAMDILFPGVGELIGGSERESDYDKLLQRTKESGVDVDSFWWYFDLRKFGTAPHSGFGLGFARALMYITNMSNIRDVIPFPRIPRNAEF